MSVKSTGDALIKQFEMSDLGSLLTFLRIAYPGEPRKSDEAFWTWHFLENPYTSDDNVPLWIVKAGDEIVGQLASIPIELKVGAENERAIWPVDYFLLPEYRRGGLGIRLLKASESYCKTSLALGYNESSSAVMRFLRWRNLGNINRYHILLFPGNAVREISRFAPARKLANLLFAPFRFGLKQKTTGTNGELRDVTEFDSTFDELWKDASAQWPCAVVRSSRFLEWQFMKQPGKKYDVIGYHKDDRLLGYIVLYFRKSEHGAAPPKVAISDLCYGRENPDDVIENLLRGALQLAVERQTGSLVIDVLDDRVEKILRSVGFRRIKASPAFAAKTTEHQDLIFDRSNWFLTRGDSDVSIFEEENSD